MSKIKNISRLISTTKNKFCNKFCNKFLYKPNYAIGNFSKKSLNDVFSRYEAPKHDKPSFLGDRDIDHLTEDVLQ